MLFCLLFLFFEFFLEFFLEFFSIFRTMLFYLLFLFFGIFFLEFFSIFRTMLFYLLFLFFGIFFLEFFSIFRTMLFYLLFLFFGIFFLEFFSIFRTMLFYLLFLFFGIFFLFIGSFFGISTIKKILSRRSIFMQKKDTRHTTMRPQMSRERRSTTTPLCTNSSWHWRRFSGFSCGKCVCTRSLTGRAIVMITTTAAMRTARSTATFLMRTFSVPLGANWCRSPHTTAMTMNMATRKTVCRRSESVRCWWEQQEDF